MATLIFNSSEEGMPAASVTPRDLLEGAAYALEQCGLLLRDANVLYRNSSYPSAVALAAFAREELGRWKILRKLRTEVLGGKHLTIKDIQDACGDHESKQRAGALSISMKADRNSQLGKLIHTFTAAATEQLEKLRRQKGKRIPSERHKQRMTALYVDPIPGGWNRPAKEVTQDIAYNDLQEAANDYRGPYDRYTNPENHKPDDPGFYSALEHWTDRPTLPRPESP
jgi:AbiV family abortive infection protein